MDAATSTDGTPDPEWVATPARYYPDRYEVTACGRIRSVDRESTDAHGRTRRYRGRELKPWVDGRGYLMVGLSGGRVGDRRTVPMHVLVKEAFHGPTPLGLEICHGDGDGTNCHLWNLIFDTSAANKADIKRHGRNYWLNRDRCDWGHLLDGDNVIVRTTEGTTRRRCVACSRARSALDHLRSTGRDGDFREIADKKYAEIMAGTNGRHTAGAAIATCPRDHLLVKPNLVQSNPGRTCLACSRAHAKAAFERRKGRPFDFEANADARYAVIMAGVDVDALRAELLAGAEIPAVIVEPYERQPSRRLAPKAPQTGEPILDLPGERWCDIPGWEGTHQVSNLGRVKSLDRWIACRGRADRWMQGTLFAPTPDRNGYPVVGLPDRSTKSGSRTHLVHLLVMLAFRGPTPAGLEVLHGDGNRGNACLDNLRFGTHAENQQEMVRHGNGPGDRQAREARGLIRLAGRREHVGHLPG